METKCFYHSRSSAIATVLGGCLVAGLSIGAVVSGTVEGGWTIFIGVVGAFGVVMGLSQLLSGKPEIIVSDDGIRIPAGLIAWDSIRGMMAEHAGFPIRLHLKFTLDNGHQLTINLQELNVRPGYALEAITKRMQIRRPDLFASPDA